MRAGSRDCRTDAADPPLLGLPLVPVDFLLPVQLGFHTRLSSAGPGLYVVPLRLPVLSNARCLVALFVFRRIPVRDRGTIVKSKLCDSTDLPPAPPARHTRPVDHTATDCELPKVKDEQKPRGRTSARLHLMAEPPQMSSSSSSTLSLLASPL